jgi:hypothetical protein
MTEQADDRGKTRESAETSAIVRSDESKDSLAASRAQATILVR